MGLSTGDLYLFKLKQLCPLIIVLIFRMLSGLCSKYYAFLSVNYTTNLSTSLCNKFLIQDVVSQIKLQKHDDT